MKFFKMNGVAAIKLTWIISIADALAILTYFFYCGNLPFAGVTQNYPDIPVQTPVTLVSRHYVNSLDVVVKISIFA